MTPKSNRKRPYSPPKIREIAADDLRPEDHLKFAQVRHLYLDDSSKERATEIVADLFSHSVRYIRNEIRDDLIPGPIHQTDLLVLSGENHNILSDFLSNNEILITRVAKFVIFERPSVKERVFLLKSGADAIFDSTTIDINEARAQIAAIWSRYLQVSYRHMEDLDLKEALKKYFSAPLSDREEKIASILVKNLDSPTNLKQLQYATSNEKFITSKEHVRILILKLRKKIKSEFKIINFKGIGYQIVSC